MPPRHKKPLPEPVRATIDSLSHEGRGVAHLGGKAVFIDGALPGETVTFRYTRRRAKFAEGYAIDILQPSPRRAQPQCRHYTICGGCSLQHMPAADQIEHKQKVLLEQFRHIGNIEPEAILPPLRSPEWGYRRKARLGLKYVFKKEKLLIGFREKRSNYVADLETCEVLHPAIGKRITELQSFIRGLDCYDQIPQLEVAIGDNVTALIFRHLVELTVADRERLAAFQQQAQIAVYLQAGGPETVLPLNDQTATDLSYRLDQYGIEIHFRPDDFTQVNFAINNAMVARVIELLAPQSGDTVLDLFCGLGNFSLPVARQGAAVTGIEISVRLVQRARENATRNGISNVEFLAIDLMQADLAIPVFKKTYNKILIDPPRNGAREIIEHLSFDGVDKLVYVSCNPATLARDAGILVRDKGLRLQQAGILDMFPQTSHVESIALFEPR
ncbi:MAG: 23S rRNA methyltransferase [Gammaproteobacteria bacterium]|nr:23S rRNA methyltransferase [Gammaproteobacteria bacterium]